METLKRIARDRWLWWPLLALLGAVVVHLVLRLMGSTAPGPVIAGVLEIIANLVIASAVGSVAFILLVRSLRQLLWRVRRKLILSYILTGLLPIVLIAIVFLVAGR